MLLISRALDIARACSSKSRLHFRPSLLRASPVPSDPFRSCFSHQPCRSLLFLAIAFPPEWISRGQPPFCASRSLCLQNAPDWQRFGVPCLFTALHAVPLAPRPVSTSLALLIWGVSRSQPFSSIVGKNGESARLPHEMRQKWVKRRRWRGNGVGPIPERANSVQTACKSETACKQRANSVQTACKQRANRCKCSTKSGLRPVFAIVGQICSHFVRNGTFVLQFSLVFAWRCWSRPLQYFRPQRRPIRAFTTFLVPFRPLAVVCLPWC